MHDHATTTKLPSTENDVKKIVIQWFKNLGGWSFAPPPSRGMGVHGVHDRIGVIPITVTSDMVGKRVGLFVSIEAKKPGRRGEKLGGATQAQVDFAEDVIFHRGISAIVDSDLDLHEISNAIFALRQLSAPEEFTNAIGNKLLRRTSGNG